MVNQNFESDNHSTPKFEMAELPQEIGKDGLYDAGGRYLQTFHYDQR